jgi:hypothetical protein
MVDGRREQSNAEALLPRATLSGRSILIQQHSSPYGPGAMLLAYDGARTGRRGNPGCRSETRGHDTATPYPLIYDPLLNLMP